MQIALLSFSVSLIGILGLFTLRHFEDRRGARVLQRVRVFLDAGALRLKAWIGVVELYVEHAPWFLSALSRYLIHVGALSFARLARTAAEQAHRLADFVSHKRNFERKETKSSYLKQVREFKNGEGSVSGETDQNSL